MSLGTSPHCNNHSARAPTTGGRSCQYGMVETMPSTRYRSELAIGTAPGSGTGTGSGLRGYFFCIMHPCLAPCPGVLWSTLSLFQLGGRLCSPSRFKTSRLKCAPARHHGTGHRRVPTCPPPLMCANPFITSGLCVSRTFCQVCPASKEL